MRSQCDRLEKLRTWAFNQGIMDGWNGQLPRDLPEELVSLNDPDRSEAWLTAYAEGYREGLRSALPHGD